VVEPGARVRRAIVTRGGIVRSGETAEDVAVLPAAALGREADAGGRVEWREEMAWVELR
jgi:hypothetical protein